MKEKQSRVVKKKRTWTYEDENGSDLGQDYVFQGIEQAPMVLAASDAGVKKLRNKRNPRKLKKPVLKRSGGLASGWIWVLNKFIIILIENNKLIFFLITPLQN
jgi:hypothetical protein